MILAKKVKHAKKRSNWIAKSSGETIFQILIIGSSVFFAYTAIQGIWADDVVFGRTAHRFHFHGLAGWLVAASQLFLAAGFAWFGTIFRRKVNKFDYLVVHFLWLGCILLCLGIAYSMFSSLITPSNLTSPPTSPMSTTS